MSESSYQGSQAFNQFLSAHESVNKSTGALAVSIDILDLAGINKTIPLKLQLVYTGGTQSILGLPAGWTFTLPYTLGTSATIGGKAFVIDPTWSDETGYESGLRYVNNHGVKFQSVVPPQPLPSGNPGSYGSLYTYGDGSHAYFDVAGKLLERDDRYGNAISYEYNDQFGGVVGNYLTKIVDSFGQEVALTYGANTISIACPNGGAFVIEYASSGVQSVVDELGYRTSFTYTTVGSRSAINTIAYPTGLRTTLTYTTITALLSGGGSESLPAVETLTHTDQDNGILSQRVYTYGSKTGGNTFTGANQGYTLSPTGDGLMDSNNTNYEYDVVITDVDSAGAILTASAMFYNYLHLPVRSYRYEVRDGVASDAYQTVYEYDINPDKHARSTNYDKPKSVEQLVWSASAARYLSLRKDTTVYDAYGNLSQKTRALYQRDVQAYADQESTTCTYTVVTWPGPGGLAALAHTTEMPQSRTHEDLVTGYTKKLEMTLTADAMDIASQVSEFATAKNPGAWRPWKTNEYTYDAQGRVTSHALAWTNLDDHSADNSRSTSKTYAYAYDAQSRQLTITTTDALGNAQVDVHDVSTAKLPLVRSTLPSGQTTQYEYDAVGRLTRKTNPLGNAWTIAYDVQSVSGSNKETHTTPVGYITERYFDALSRPIKTMDNGNVLAGATNTAPQRTTSTTAYDAIGHVSATTDILGLVTTYEFDSLGRPTEEVDPLGNVHTTAYVNDEQQSSASINGSLRTLTRKDGLGRTSSVAEYADADDQTSDYYLLHKKQYDGFGQQIAESSTQVATAGAAETLLHETAFSYDLDGRVASKDFTGYAGSEATCSKTIVRALLGHPSETLKKVQYDGGGTYEARLTQSRFNAVGLLTAQVDQAGGTEAYDYDANGQLAGKTRPDGSTWSYSYDGAGNLVSLDTGTELRQYSYDADNRIISAAEGDQVISYGYYLDGSLARVTYPGGLEQRYERDPYGRLTTLTDVSGATTRTTYTAAGQTASVEHAGDSIQYTYGCVNHTNGTLVRTTLAGNLAEETAYDYDGFGEVARVVQQTGAETLLDVAYERNALRQLTQISQLSNVTGGQQLNLSKTFCYDGLGQLTRSKVVFANDVHPPDETSFVYDGNHNVLEKTVNEIEETFTYNAADQLVADGVVYDGNGRMTADGLGNEYVYDAFDKVTKVAAASGATTEYGYYPDGTLASTRGAGIRQQLYYDAARAVSCMRSTADQQATWTTYLFDGSRRVAAYGSAARLLVTANRSTVATFEGDSLTSYRYSDYGEAESGSLPAGADFGWNQEYTAPGAPVVCLGARFYHPRLMRFMSMDSYPVDNRYAYCEGDPLNRIDPTGHTSIGTVLLDVTGIVVGLAAAIAAPFTGGSSLAVGAAVVSGVLGAASSAVALAGSETGNKDAETASWVLAGASACIDIASAGAGLMAKGASRASSEVEEIEMQCFKSACFAAGTSVETAAGPKNIEDVEVGDIVLGRDVTAGAEAKEAVVETIARATAEVVVVGIGSDSVTTTPRHPFYVDGKWVPAEHLQPGDTLLTVGGAGVQVTSVERRAEHIPVFNIEVPVMHNYFVSAARVLVHNPCTGEGGTGPTASAASASSGGLWNALKSRAPKFFTYFDDIGAKKTYPELLGDVAGVQKREDLPFEAADVERLGGAKNARYRWARSAVSVPVKTEEGREVVATAEYLHYTGAKDSVTIMPNGELVWGRAQSKMAVNYLPGMQRAPMEGAPGFYVHRIPSQNMTMPAWHFSHYK